MEGINKRVVVTASRDMVYFSVTDTDKNVTLKFPLYRSELVKLAKVFQSW